MRKEVILYKVFYYLTIANICNSSSSTCSIMYFLQLLGEFYNELSSFRRINVLAFISYFT